MVNGREMFDFSQTNKGMKLHYSNCNEICLFCTICFKVYGLHYIDLQLQFTINKFLLRKTSKNKVIGKL